MSLRQQIRVPWNESRRALRKLMENGCHASDPKQETEKSSSTIRFEAAERYFGEKLENAGF